jgi:hypothetical protein
MGNIYSIVGMISRLILAGPAKNFYRHPDEMLATSEESPAA